MSHFIPYATYKCYIYDILGDMRKIFSYFIIAILFVVPHMLVAQAVNYQVVPDQIADSSIPPTITITPDVQLQSQCESCSYTAYRLVRQLNCGATVAVRDVLSNKPTCKMVPRVSMGGAVILEWDTIDADVAFIDGGVGHVNPEGGARIVTPTKDTTYNMTVINQDGVVGVCSAQVNINDAKAQQNEILVLSDEKIGTLSGVNAANDMNTASQRSIEGNVNNVYAYNESAVNKNTYKINNGTIENNTVSAQQSQNVIHTATMSVNGAFVNIRSFFTDGLFLIFSFLIVFLIAIWLIVRHGVR